MGKLVLFRNVQLKTEWQYSQPFYTTDITRYGVEYYKGYSDGCEIKTENLLDGQWYERESSHRLYNDSATQYPEMLVANICRIKARSLEHYSGTLTVIAIGSIRRLKKKEKGGGE